MEICHLRRPDPGYRPDIEWLVDLQLDCGIRLFGLAVTRTDKGLRVRPPQSKRHLATSFFTKEAATKILDLTQKAIAQHDRAA
ncbi:hypothetical protein C5L14_16655 [Labrys okinawensis]|uniref:Uncharacterized protein n=1 Tax=Labrys okinawensis TaxID=346911 RepID=A0A2S9QC36_9HYPH|nr:hypothetical protein [Labrys okinawensis]PRH86916.1 hypothetical protein C5L14_16655 [Labrys okinawensis]